MKECNEKKENKIRRREDYQKIVKRRETDKGLAKSKILSKLD